MDLSSSVSSLILIRGMICRSDVGTREGHEANHLECHYETCARYNQEISPSQQGLWKTGPVWLIWHPPVARWPSKWMRKRLWMLSPWTLVKALTLWNFHLSPVCSLSRCCVGWIQSWYQHEAPALFPASFHIWGCGHGLQGSAESSHTSLDL